MTATQTATTLEYVTVEIASESTPSVTYTVSAAGCTCPSFTYRQRPCKHMAAPAVIDATLAYLGWTGKVATVITTTPAAAYITAPATSSSPSLRALPYGPQRHIHRGGLGCIDC